MMGIIVSSFLMIFIVFSFILYIYILIDILRYEFTGYNKVIWIIVLICFPVLGAILYLVFGRGQRIKKK
jgi:hypothetical protein